jgi:acetyl esterase
MPSFELDPEIAVARARQARAAGTFDITKMPPVEGRIAADRAALFFNDGLPTIFETRNLSIPTEWGRMRARLYSPSAHCSGAVLFVHGGGWFNGNVDTHDRLMRYFASTSGLAVLGFDYRLAPENPYPKGFEDTRTAWRWFRENAASLNIDRDKLVVAGDSAGANLALAMALAERETATSPKALALFYGCYAPTFDTGTHLAFGDGRYGLTTVRMRWYWEMYAGRDLINAPSAAAPLRADLSNLPPTYLALAALDPIADDTRILAARLKGARVPHVLKEWSGACHGFLQMTRDVAIARDAVADAVDFLGRTPI